jgi:hypothetical protein
MNRRGYLAATVSASTALLAGCTGGDSAERAPPQDANPRDLLPAPPDSWTRTDVQQQSAGFVGAEAGFGASYEGPDGVRYAVEVLRWSSGSDAESKAPGVYDSGWPVLVVAGNFSFAGKGPDVETVETLLGSSSALTVEYVRANTENE